MILRFFQFSAVVIAIALAAPSALAADLYKVSAQISHAGEAIGNPVLRVNDQSRASVAISGDKGYEFSVHLAPVDGDAIEVTVQLATSQGRVSSVVTTRVDRPISVSAGDIGLTVTVSRADNS